MSEMSFKTFRSLLLVQIFQKCNAFMAIKLSGEPILDSVMSGY